MMGVSLKERTEQPEKTEVSTMGTGMVEIGLPALAIAVGWLK